MYLIIITFSFFFFKDSYRKKSAKGCSMDSSGYPINTIKEQKNKKGTWTLNCAKLMGSKANNMCPPSTPAVASASTLNTDKSDSCVCTSYKKVDENSTAVESSNKGTIISASPLFPNATTTGSAAIHLPGILHHTDILQNNSLLPPLQDFPHLNGEDYSIEDCDEAARIKRALEIEQGVEPPPGFTRSEPSISINPIYSLTEPTMQNDTSSSTLANHITNTKKTSVIATVAGRMSAATPRNAPWPTDFNPHSFMLSNFQLSADEIPKIVIHSQVSLLLLLLFKFIIINIIVLLD